MAKYLFNLVIRPIAQLPLSVLYHFGNVAYLVIYQLVGYRKPMVVKNIAMAFPEYSVARRKKLVKGFYRYLSDMLIETVWMFGITEAKIRKHFFVTNPDLVNQFYDQNKSVIIVLAHYSSWEVVLASLNLFIKHQCETIYVPLSNSGFDREYLSMRTKFNSKMVSKKEFKDNVGRSADNRAIIFGADQSPSISKNIHWTSFLNQPTAVATGVERYAVKYDMPVIYAHFYPFKRGSFNLTFELLTDQPSMLPEGQITELHVRRLERQIIERPEYWLWSHNRWKKKPDQTTSFASSCGRQEKEYC